MRFSHECRNPAGHDTTHQSESLDTIMKLKVKVNKHFKRYVVVGVHVE